MSKEKLKLIKEAELTNNCPECFNQGLSLGFYQRHVYSKFYHKITSNVTHEIRCKKCDSNIYPVKWTDDIERSFDYYKKLAIPQKKKLRFTTFFYGILLFFLALCAATIYAVLEGLITI